MHSFSSPIRVLSSLGVVFLTAGLDGQEPTPRPLAPTPSVSSGSLPAAAPSSESRPRGPALRPYRASPPCTLTQGLGLATVSLSYHRPAVKGRVIWGALVPFGEVWRAGANEATTLSLSHPVKAGGQVLPAGTYALFVVPEKDRWTFILNRKAKQWGSYFHDPKEDQLRVEASVRPLPHEEWLRFSLEPVDEGTLRLELAWERQAAGFDLSLDVRGTYWAHLEEVIAKADPKDWAPWFQAASYCWGQRIHLDKAHDWVDVSLAAQESFWNQELKANLLHRLGKRGEALRRLERAIELSMGKAPKAYTENLEKQRQEWLRPRDPDTLCPPCLE